MNDQPGVESVVRILQPYKLVNREFHAGKDSAPPWLGNVYYALLVIGGCCHDYANQKDILTKGISALDTLVDGVHSPDSTLHGAWANGVASI